MGDRSGGREPKGSSLKKSKKNPGCAAAKTKKQAKVIQDGPSTTTPPPIPGNELHFDCAAAILSRQFDRDRERILIRAQTEGNCCGILTWFSDIEKQSNLAELCKLNSGLLYFVTGVHPDNVDRTNKKSHDGWLEKTEELAKRPECIGILTGLNLSREMGTHFAQETLLKSSCELADRLLLPIVLHVSDSTSLEKAIEILKENSWIHNSDVNSHIEHHRVLIHDVVTSTGGNYDKIQLVKDANCYCIVSATGLTDPDPIIQNKSITCLRMLSWDKLLICSDSPWKTPQNIPDAYLRTLRNEPCNVPFVVKALHEAVCDDQITILSFSQILKSNALKVFGMEYLDEEQTTQSRSHLENKIETNVNRDENESDNKKHLKQTMTKRDKEILSNLNELIEVIDIINDEELIKQEDTEKLNDSNQNHDGLEKDSSMIIPLAYYGCLKCRLQLFKLKEVHIHDLDTKKTVFEAGEEHGLCKSTLFILCNDSKEISKRTGMQVRGSNVECSECGTKIGKYSAGESSCACGAVVTGPTVRIQSQKVDFFDVTIDADELLARSRLEAEEAHRNALLDEDESLRGNIGGKKDKRMKKMRSDNKRSNFSNYRNKQFKSKKRIDDNDDEEDDSNSQSTNIRAGNAIVNKYPKDSDEVDSEVEDDEIPDNQNNNEEGDQSIRTHLSDVDVQNKDDSDTENQNDETLDSDQAESD